MEIEITAVELSPSEVTEVVNNFIETGYLPLTEENNWLTASSVTNVLRELRVRPEVVNLPDYESISYMFNLVDKKEVNSFFSAAYDINSDDTLISPYFNRFANEAIMEFVTNIR
jgi:hypothetical protein